MTDRGRGRNNQRGRGGGGRYHKWRETDSKVIILYPPNMNRGTLSNFVEWKKFIYHKAKDATKFMHRLVITDAEPTVYSSMNKNIILECYHVMNEAERQSVLEEGIWDANILDALPEIRVPAERKNLRKVWLDAKMEVYRDLERDKPLLFNLMINSLSLTSLELIKGNLGEEFDIVRSESNVMQLWHAILITHNNGVNLPPVDKNQFRLKFLTEKMHANEALSVFNKRFSEMEQTMSSIDEHFDVNSIDHFITYVNALDNKRYAQFKTDFFNDLSKEEDRRAMIPRTRGELFILINNYVTTNKFTNSNVDRYRSAYAIIDESKSNNETNITNESNSKAVSNYKGKWKNKPKASHQKKPYSGCFTCGGMDHNSFNCSISKEDAKRILQAHIKDNIESKETKKIELFCGSIGKAECESAISLDTMSQVHVFNDKCQHLTNIRKIDDKIILKGIGNQNVPVDSIGDFKGINVYVTSKVNSNILSFGILTDEFPITYDNEDDQFTLTLNDEILKFRKDKDLYKCYEVAAISNENLSKVELERVNLIKDLYAKLAFPSNKIVEKLIKNRSIKGLNVDLSDFKNYLKICDQPIESIRAKTTRVKNAYIPISDQARQQMLQDRCIDLALDIFFVSGYVFMIVVNLAFDLTNIRVLKDRSAAEILDAIKEFINIYSAYNWKVRRIYSDMEKGVMSAEKEILECEKVFIEYVAPGSHVSVAERKIRTIKERSRAMLQNIKHKLPLKLLPWLIKYAVIRLNQCETVHTSGTSPREVLTGEVLDLHKDLPLKFGQIVEIAKPVQDSTMNARTEPAIYIGPANNQAASHFFCNKNGQIVMRSKWIVANNPEQLDWDDFIDIEQLGTENESDAKDLDDFNDYHYMRTHTDQEPLESQDLFEQPTAIDHQQETNITTPNFAMGKYFSESTNKVD